MAQIKKFQTGTGSEGIQPSKLKFKINGNDFEKDEQFVRDQFEPVFNELVASGSAKARDRDQWKNSFQQYLTQARNGLININSSSGKVLDSTYTPNNTGTTPELGLNADGTEARKTVVGNIISPRQQNEQQRMGFINGLIGNRLIGAYDTDTLAAKTKADAEAAKAKGDKRTAALDKLKGFSAGYGEYGYGQDFKTSPDLVYNKWYDPKVTDAHRMAGMSTYYGDRFKSIFDTGLDEYKDDADFKTALNGRSLEEVRKQAQQYYDPTKGTFIKPAKTLAEFNQYANVLDTMDADNKFQDKNAWNALKVAQANASKTPEQIQTEQAQAQQVAATTIAITPSGKYFKDKDGRMYTDSAGKNRVDGWQDGVLWRGGSPYEGHYIGRGISGDQDYSSSQTGAYVKGKKVDLEEYNNWYRSLEGTPSLAAYRGLLDQRKAQADIFYNKNYAGTSAYVDNNVIQDKDASDFILKDYKGKYTHAQNITGQFKGLNGVAVANVKDINSANGLGKPFVKNVVRVKGENGGEPKTYTGYLKKDNASGNYIFIGEDGREVPAVSKKFKNVQYDPNTDNSAGARLFRMNMFSEKPDNQIAGTTGLGRGVRGEQPAGVGKFQLGGNIAGVGQGNSAQKRHQQATVRDILDSSSSNYNLSNLDKWELGALAGDLTGVVASLSGAGSTVAGGLGVASTAVQFGTDVARDGLDWGDVGRAGVGLALDAASFVPGLGIISSDIKGLRTLTKASKWLIPALTAAGVVGAAGTIKDVVSGKKKLTDLSVDDLRSIVNGIHGVIGLNRTARQIAATEGTTKNYLTMKDGKQVVIKPEDVAAINLADDKVMAAKQAIMKNSNVPLQLADIELAPTTKLNAKFWNGGLRQKVPDSNTSIGTTDTGLRIKNINNYQSDSFSDKFMRGNINKALNRDPKLAASYAADNDLNVNVTTNRFGLAGDNMRRGATITDKPGVVADEPIPTLSQPLIGLPSPSGQPEMGNFTNRIQQTATQRPIVDVTDPTQIVDIRNTGRVNDRMSRVREAKQVRAQERLAIKEKEQLAQVQINNQKQVDLAARQAEVGKKLDAATARVKGGNGVQTSMFGDKPNVIKKQQGGILFAQAGSRIPYMQDDVQPFDITQYLGIPKPLPSVVSPFKTQNILPELTNPGYINPVYKTPEVVRPSLNMANKQVTPAGKSLFGKIGNVVKGIDPITASEFGRALWTRNQNSQIDTRIERPMLSAPSEVSVPVRGNLLAGAAYNNQANNITRAAGQPQGSDAMLYAASNLEANRNAGALRAQGDMANVEAIEKSRGMALENDFRNNQARNNVANQNIQTLARAAQGERGAENEKQARMNQPLADFWKDQNYKAMVKEQQNKGIDTAIALQGKNNNFQLMMQPLQQQYNQNWMKLSSGRLNQAEVDALQADNAAIDKKVQWLTNQSTVDQLQTRKNINYVTPKDWFTKGLPTVAVKKEGGAVKVALENQKQAGLQSRAIAKQHDEYMADGIKDESKKSLQAMKQIQELIKLALS